MQNSEKLCLKWNYFHENRNSAFGAFRDDKELADVTLACEDGSHVTAHKVILAASSPLFMGILAKNKHPHPLVYMRGVRKSELLAILDFIYYGEANVEQENLDAFLVLAEEMQLKGLTGSAETGNHDDKTPNPLQKKTEQKKHANTSQNMWHPMNSNQSKAEDDSMHVALVSEGVQQLDEQIKSMMEVSENMLTIGNRTVRAKTCKVCGKEGQTANIMTHIESNHITASNISHSCDICGKISRSRNGLRLHKAKEHPSCNNLAQIETVSTI